MALARPGNRRIALVAAVCAGPLVLMLLLLAVVPQRDGAPTAGPATASHLPPQTTLYVVGTIMDRLPVEPRGTRLTAIDRTTWRERYRIGGVDEATLSPDGAQLFTAGSTAATPEADQIRAFDATTGQELWRTALTHRAGYPGQQNLLVSPDGRWLYVRSYDIAQGTGNANSVPFWLQIIDTRDGRLLDSTIALPTIDLCGAPRLVSPTVGTYAYLSCYNGMIYAVDTTLQQLVQPLGTGSQGSVFVVNGTELALMRPGLQLDRLAASPSTGHVGIALQPDPSLSATVHAIGVSADGRRVIAGQTIQDLPGTDTATELGVFDATTGEQIGRWRFDRPLRNLTVDATGERVYGTWTEVQATESSIVEFTLPGGAPRTVHARPGEAIGQLFLGP